MALDRSRQFTLAVIKITLASGKIKVIVFAEAFHDRLKVCRQLQGLYGISAVVSPSISSEIQSNSTVQTAVPGATGNDTEAGSTSLGAKIRITNGIRSGSPFLQKTRCRSAIGVFAGPVVMSPDTPMPGRFRVFKTLEMRSPQHVARLNNLRGRIKLVVSVSKSKILQKSLGSEIQGVMAGENSGGA